MDTLWFDTLDTLSFDALDRLVFDPPCTLARVLFHTFDRLCWKVSCSIRPDWYSICPEKTQCQLALVEKAGVGYGKHLGVRHVLDTASTGASGAS